MTEIYWVATKAIIRGKQNLKSVLKKKKILKSVTSASTFKKSEKEKLTKPK